MEHPDHNRSPLQSWVWRDRWNRPRAYCACGWNGPRRWFRISAISDAWTHAHQTGHMPTYPIDLWKPARKAVSA